MMFLVRIDCWGVVGLPLFWDVLFLCVIATIVEHHWTRVPTGTSCRIPFFTCLSSSLLTSCFQWNGLGIGLCLAYETMINFKWIWAGGPELLWNSDGLLNAVLAKLEQRYCSNFGTFSSVGVNDIFLDMLVQ